MTNQIKENNNVYFLRFIKPWIGKSLLDIVREQYTTRHLIWGNRHQVAIHSGYITWRKLTRLAELSHFCPPSRLLELARVYMALHAELLTRLTGVSFSHIILPMPVWRGRLGKIGARNISQDFLLVNLIFVSMFVSLLPYLLYCPLLLKLKVTISNNTIKMSHHRKR